MAKTRANSLMYDLNCRSLDGHCSSKTVQAYKKANKKFVEWARARKIKTFAEVTQEVVQAYVVWLDHEGKSPNTIHTYIAPLCKALGLDMRLIFKRKRTSDTLSRSRRETANMQGKRQLQAQSDSRLVELQQVAGLRRAELAKLRRRDFVEYGGYWCLHVRKGKGGKEQYQRILPEDVERCRQIVEQVPDDDSLIFSKSEMNNKIDLHGLRAEQARKAYAYYVDRLGNDPDYRQELQHEIMDYFGRMHVNPTGAKLQRFESLLNNESDIRLRGENRRRAITNGRPTVYDRLAVLAVSVFHLSHWRTDVTITNYLV